MSSFDYVIQNALIVDGTGAPGFHGDVGIREDRIAAVGKISTKEAAEVIDAEGRFLVPGFVDAHVHSDLKLLENPDFPAAVYQGVTSHVIGQDGISYAPSSSANQARTRRYFGGVSDDPELAVSWESVADYLGCFDRRVAINVAYLLPQGTIRLEVMGYKTGRPTPEETSQMQWLAVQGMRGGAVGISTGLDYIPCFYAETEELVDLCRPVGELGGIYVAHIRSYGERIAEAVEETARIGREAGLPVHISHYNGPAPLLTRLVDEARAKGSDMTFDTYPYLAGCTILTMVALPRWMEEGGTEMTLARLADPAVRKKLDPWFAHPPYPWEGLQFSFIDHPEDWELEGLRLPEAAAQRGQTIANFICELLLRTKLRVACIAHHSNRTEDDMIQLMRHPSQMGGSDGIYTGSCPHPRGYGTFARFLEYVRDRQVMPLEEMVAHLSAHPARRFHLKHRGLIAEGYHADLALFDLARIKSCADYQSGSRLAEGMDWVFVNGKPVLAEAKATHARPGVGVRGPAWTP